MSVLSRGQRPRLDSPTYLFISGVIDGDEWVRRIQTDRVRLGLPAIENLQPPKHATPEEVERFRTTMRSATRPRLDSPTYLRITGQIDESEYHRRLNERRLRYGLPALERKV